MVNIGLEKLVRPCMNGGSLPSGGEVLRSGVFFTQKKRLSRKGWLNFNSLNLTNRLAWADMEDNVSGTGSNSSKGESMTMVAEAGAEDTGSDDYRRSDKEGVWIQLGRR